MRSKSNSGLPAQGEEPSEARLRLAEWEHRARVEEALERVRAQTLAMHRSEELADAAVVVFHELKTLGIEPRRCGFAIHQGGTPVWQFWHTTGDGRAIEQAGLLSEEKIPYFQDVFAAWRAGDRASITATFSGAVLDRLIHFLLERTEVNLPDAAEEVAHNAYPAQVCFNFFFFTDGALLAHTLNPLGDRERAVLERFARAFDLTYRRFLDLKRAEEQAREVERALDELKQAQDQLIRSEKLAALGSLTTGIAHEIKNPLNFINNFATLNLDLADEIAEALAGGEDAAGLLALLRENSERIILYGKRADEIVRTMMQHAAAVAGKRRPTELNAFVEEQVNRAYHAKRAQAPGFEAKVEYAADPGVGTVNLIPEEIGRVLRNLLSNAFDAVEERAASATAGSYTPTVKLSTRTTEGGCEIRIADNGTGISWPVLDKIFEPFFTTKPPGRGTGLGLSLAYDIVTHRHGGTLEVEGSEGRGATFIVTLPRTA